jgi:hypothetical protein
LSAQAQRTEPRSTDGWAVCRWRGSENAPSGLGIYDLSIRIAVQEGVMVQPVKARSTSPVSRMHRRGWARRRAQRRAGTIRVRPRPLTAWERRVLVLTAAAVTGGLAASGCRSGTSLNRRRYTSTPANSERKPRTSSITTSRRSPSGTAALAHSALYGAVHSSACGTFGTARDALVLTGHVPDRALRAETGSTKAPAQEALGWSSSANSWSLTTELGTARRGQVRPL